MKLRPPEERLKNVIGSLSITLKPCDDGHIGMWLFNEKDRWATVCQATHQKVYRDVTLDGCPVCLKYHGLAQELVAIANLERSVS